MIALGIWFGLVWMEERKWLFLMRHDSSDINTPVIRLCLGRQPTPLSLSPLPGLDKTIPSGVWYSIIKKEKSAKRGKEKIKRKILP